MRLRLISGFMALAAISAAVAGTAEEHDRIGDWSLNAETVADGRRVCMATGPFGGDSQLQLSLVGESFVLSLISLRWTAAHGDTIRLVASIDDRWRRTLSGSMESGLVAMVRFAVDDPAIAHMRRGRRLRVAARGTVLSFDLTGSEAAIDAVFACRGGRDRPRPAATAPAAGGTVLEEFDAGEWTGLAQADGDGRFQICLIVVSRPRLPLLGFYRSASGFAVGMVDERWRLPVGTSNTIRLRVDDRWATDLTARVFDTDMVMGFVDDGIAAAAALSRGRTLVVEVPQRSYRFDLSGSAAAVARLGDCYRRHAGIAVAGTRDGRPAGGGAASATANPFAPAPASGTDGGVASANPFLPGAADRPADIGTPAAVGPRPPSALDGVQRVVPEMAYELFVMWVMLVVPGDPEVSRAPPDDRLADYKFRGETTEGRFVGAYLEVAPQGATIAELLYHFMWAEEVTCSGPPRALDRDSDRVGETVVAWEGIECDGPGGVQYRSAVLSGDARLTQVFIVYGGAPARDAAAALYDLLRSLARRQ